MGRLDDETLDDLSDPLLRALARTPEVAPFAGTARYRVEACLGEGGFGVVYEVDDRQLGRRLALKLLKAGGLAGNVGRFKREFRSVADLVHPNLVGLHELSAAGARWFFTMDLVRGRDFLAHVGDSHARLREALRQLVAGVQALHRAGIVHRDLKPSNVLVEDDGRVVILDFGLAGRELGVDLDLPVAGTPLYMAPEVAAGLPATHHADWYAVGVMLYQALTGSIPAMHPAFSVDAPADLVDLCRGLLAREPDARPDGAAILARLGGSSLPTERRAERSLFFGRARELGQLSSGLDAVRTGKPSLIRIHGQPGVGKSALLDRFLAGLGEATVLAARCHERESVPFKAFDGVADALVRHLNRLRRAEAAALMPRDIHLVTQLFPVFDGLAAVRDLPRRRAQLADPREVRLRAFAALKELVAGIAGKAPLVIAIDDLQWSDIDSARLLSHLVAPPERPPLLLLLSYRDEEAESPILRETLRMLEAAGERGIDLALSPLPAADAEKLAAALLGQSGLTARQIAERGEGHPLFIAELARALRHSDAAADAPPSLFDILWRRVAQLSDGARALLETVAVAGRPLPSHLCFEAAGLAGAGVDAVRVLRAEQLVRAADDGSINVFHDRIRDAVLRGAGADRQRQRHLGLARSLERTPGWDPETLARHFDAADHHAEAARHALRAADAAMGALAFDRAAALYRMAIDRGVAASPADLSSLHEKLGDALLHAGSSTDAGRAYLAAAAHTDGLQATDLRRRAAELMLTVGDIEPGYRALEESLADVGEKVPATLGRAVVEGIYHLCLMRLRRFRFRELDPADIAREQLLRLDVLESAARGLGYLGSARSFAVAMRFSRAAAKTGDPRRAAFGLTWSAFGLTGALRARRAILDQVLDAADATAERIADDNLRAWSMRMRAETYFHFGELDRARDLFVASAAYISDRCSGMASDQRHVRMLASVCQARQGRLAEARVIAESLLLDAVERNDPVAEKCVCVAVLAPLSLAAGDPDRAEEFMARGEREDRCGIAVMRAETAAAIAMYGGRAREAVAAWRRSWSLLTSEGMLIPPAFRLAAARSLGVALLTCPRDRDDLAQARRLARSIRRLDFPHAAAVRDCLRAYFHLRAGKPERAAPLMVRAADQYRVSGMHLDAAACRHRAGLIAGGPEGDAMAAAAESELAGLGVACPARWAAMHSPAPS